MWQLNKSWTGFERIIGSTRFDVNLLGEWTFSFFSYVHQIYFHAPGRLIV